MPEVAAELPGALMPSTSLGKGELLLQKKTCFRILAGRACPDKEGPLRMLAASSWDSQRVPETTARYQGGTFGQRPMTSEEAGLSGPAPQRHRLTI